VTEDTYSCQLHDYTFVEGGCYNVLMVPLKFNVQSDLNN